MRLSSSKMIIGKNFQTRTAETRKAVRWGELLQFNSVKWDDTHSGAGKMTDASVIFKTDYGEKIPKNRAQCITVYKVRQ